MRKDTSSNNVFDAHAERKNMKYKVMLVEDEQIIREGFETFVDWDGLGFEIVASLSDGREALQYLENNTVDLIITDIEMTFVSGLALAKYIYEKELPVKVVVLTAYPSFDYLSECMKYKVENYILKTASSIEIEEKLRVVCKQIEYERKKNEQNTKLESWASDIVLFLKERFMTKLFAGYDNREDLILDVKRSGIDINLLDTTSVRLYSVEFPNGIANITRYGYDGFRNVIHNFFDAYKSSVPFFYLIGEAVYALELQMNDIDIKDMEKEFFDLFKVEINIKKIAEFNNIFDVSASKITDLNLNLSKNDKKDESRHYIINSAVSYINDNISDGISLEKVAEKIYVSPEYLSRLFKKEIGMNFKEYLIDCKMAKAMELLKDPQYKVYEISKMIDYRTVGFFSKVFQKYTGLTPTEYRRKNL